MCFLGFGWTCPVIPPVSLETFHIIVHQPVWHCGWGCVLPQPQKYPVCLQEATVICISPAEN